MGRPYGPSVRRGPTRFAAGPRGGRPHGSPLRPERSSWANAVRRWTARRATTGSSPRRHSYVPAQSSDGDDVHRQTASSRPRIVTGRGSGGEPWVAVSLAKQGCEAPSWRGAESKPVSRTQGRYASEPPDEEEGQQDRRRGG